MLMHEIVDEHARQAHERLREAFGEDPPDHFAKPWEEMSDGERETHRRSIRFSLMDPQHHPHAVRVRRRAMIEDATTSEDAREEERRHEEADRCKYPEHVREAERLHMEAVEACRAELIG